MKTLRTVSVILLISWMALIFYLSNQTAEVSSSTSGGVIEYIIRIFNKNFDELSDAEKLELISPLQFIVRKSAHFISYAILGLFSYFSFITYTGLSLKFRLGFAAETCLLYSIFDEIHQTYIPGRSGELRDVCIDFCGSLLSIAILSLITRKAKFIKQTKSGVSMKRNDLIAANDQLFARNEELLRTVENLKAEVDNLRREIGNVTTEKEELAAKLNATPPLKALEKKMTSKANLSEETVYAGSVIGKIVVSAAKYCNLLTTLPENSMTKEQVNLILGRTEVAKSEILRELSKDTDFEEKKAAITALKESAEEYFKGVMAQTQ